MKLFALASGFAVIAVIGLSSIQKSPNISNEFVRDTLPTMLEVTSDSISIWEVDQLVKSQLLARLEGKAGLTSAWQHMDKSGHRDKVFTNAEIGHQNVTKYYIQLSSDNEVFGDLVRIDGTFRSHICSFKIVYPEGKIYARRSALDKWQTAAEFTGVKKPTPVSKNMWDELPVIEELDPVEN